MQIDEAIDLADEWARHLTPHVQDGWPVACKVLADEVRRLRAEADAPSVPDDVLRVALQRIADERAFMFLEDREVAPRMREIAGEALAAAPKPDTPLVNPASLLPAERECCGTFPRSPHRSTCRHYRGKHNHQGAQS